MFVPDVLGVASALRKQMGPLPTYSFHTPPIYISCLSLLPVLTVLALRQHLPALTWIIMNGLLDPGFSPWPPPIPAVFLMPLPLSICPWMKTLRWLFTAYRKKFKLLNTGYSLLGLEACSLLHFISRYPQLLLYSFWETLTQLLMLVQMTSLCPCWSLCPENWYSTSFPQPHQHDKFAFIFQIFIVLKDLFLWKVLVKSSYYKLWKVSLLINAFRSKNWVQASWLQATAFHYRVWNSFPLCLWTGSLSWASVCPSVKREH